MKRLVLGLILMMLLVACGGAVTPITPLPEPSSPQGTEQPPLDLQTQQDCERIHRSGRSTIAKPSVINDVAPRFYCGDFKFGDFQNSESDPMQFDGRVFITIDENRKIIGTAIPKTPTNVGVIQEQATITGKVDRIANGDVFIALTATFPTAGSHKFSGNIKIYKFTDNSLQATVIGSVMDVQNTSSDLVAKAIFSVVNKE